MSLGSAAVRFILDDGPLDHLAGELDPSQLASWASGALLVASTIGRQARQHSPLRLDLLEARNDAGEDVFEVFTVLLEGDDSAGEILLDLHGQSRSTTNLAEREAIAWALVHGRDAIFVTEDKRAALTALAELGRGRVAHPFDLWLHLADQGQLEPGQLEILCERTKSKDQGLERMPGRVRERFG